MRNYWYEETIHPITNDVVWKIDDISLALGGLSLLVKNFIERYLHDGYSLSVYDNMTARTIEIVCDVSEIPQIVEYIYNLEKGAPLTFIGVNSWTESYVVGMSVSQGKIEFGSYKTNEGKLVKM